MHGQEKACTQLFHGLNGLQSLLRIAGDGILARGQQIGIGLVVGTAHSSAQLVELSQTQAIRTVNDDGVGSRHVNAGFNNRGTQQHVVALLVEALHDGFQFALRHLAVGHCNTGFRHQFFQTGTAVMNGFDFVVQEVDLATAFQFAQQRFTYGAAIFPTYKGFDCQTFLWRCGNHGKVPYAFQGHAQGTWNRGGGQGQDIDFGTQLLQGFFLAHTKAVFLVDDDQAQLFETHIRGQDLVRTNHNIHAAVAQARNRSLGFLGRAEAGQLGNTDRPVGKTVREGLRMLLSQQGGRAQQGNLLAIGYGQEGGTQSDFGFPKAYIPADQTIHRLARRHIVHDGLNGCGLIRSLLKAETLGKGLIVIQRQLELEAFTSGALGVESQQFGRAVTCLLGCTTAGFIPLARAQLVQRRMLGVGTAVTGDYVQLGHGHIQGAALGVFQVQELDRAFAQVHFFQTAVATNPVLGVNHGVALAQFGQVPHHGFHIAAALVAATAALGACLGGVEVVFSQQAQAVVHQRKTT